MKNTKYINQYVIIRAAQAGVFAGILSSREGDEVTLTNARRIWQWAGAATLSQLSQDGTTQPDSCRFPAAVPEIVVIGVIEIIPTTEMARKSIEGVPVWKR